MVIDARSADAAALGGGARAFGREREVGRDVDLDDVELPLRNEIVGAPDNPALVFDASKVEIIDAYANDLAGMTLPGGGMGNDEED